MTTVTPPPTNVKMTVSVSMCNPLCLSIKPIALWLPGGLVGVVRGWGRGGQSLDRYLPPPPPSLASIQNKASFSFHQLCLFIGFWAASRTILLVTLLSLTALRAASDAGGQRGEIPLGQEANCQFAVSTPPHVRPLPPSRLEKWRIIRPRRSD